MKFKREIIIICKYEEALQRVRVEVEDVKKRTINRITEYDRDFFKAEDSI